MCLLLQTVLGYFIHLTQGTKQNNIEFWILVFGGEVFGRWSNLDRIMVLERLQRDEETWHCSIMWGCSKKVAIYKPGRRPSPRTQSFWRPASGTVKIRVCCLNHPFCGILLTAAWITKTPMCPQVLALCLTYNRNINNICRLKEWLVELINNILDLKTFILLQGKKLPYYYKALTCFLHEQ